MPKGEQGAGKSTACRVISSLIDPRTSALRGVLREVRDLTAAARNSRLVCFDNLSRLPEDLADAACRLATGDGFGGRQLYSDHDEAIFDATRPLVFNAIPDLGTARPDFLDQLPDLLEMLFRGRERAYLAYIFDTRSDRHDAVVLETYAEAYSAPGAPRAGFSYYRPIPRNASKQRSGLLCPTKP